MGKYIEVPENFRIERQIMEGNNSVGVRYIDLSFLPEADVAPVVHGHWEPIIDPYGNLEGWICGCGRESKEMCNYCPKCGAKMDL